MTSSLRQTYKDYSNESTKSRVNITAITAGNIVAVRANVTTFQTAEDDLTLGARFTTEILSDDITATPALPTDPNSQRERKWLVRYKTSAGNIYHYTIPCAKVDDGGTPLLRAESDFADLTEAKWVAWVSAFLTIAVGKDGNGASAVLSAELVGRSL